MESVDYVCVLRYLNILPGIGEQKEEAFNESGERGVISKRLIGTRTSKGHINSVSATR